MKQIKECFEKLFWPEICPFCGRAFWEGICPSCRKKINRILVEEPRCMKCGKPVLSETQEYCADCGHTHHYYDRGMSLWLHRKPVSTSIYWFKYHNQRVFGYYYAKEMAARFGTVIRQWRPDCIIPIPLHPRRKRQRGYNQAEILALELSRLTGVSVESKALIRSRCTTAQKKLGHQERRQNLSGAFRMEKRLKKGSTVLLIDDIYTTGNTVSSAAKALKDGGAEKVYFLTISIGQGY